VPSGAVPAPPVVRDEDIAGVRDPAFPVALRGYDRDAVDDYVREVNRLIAELQVGQSPRSAIRHALDQVSEETRSILERAHETADEITARSRVQADDRLQWAEREARDAIQAATERVQALDADAERVWEERQKLIDDVRRVAAELVEVADDANVRYPSEPEIDTSVLPELPELPPEPPPAPSRPSATAAQPPAPEPPAPEPPAHDPMPAGDPDGDPSY
jgi:DivIVA domain-containing protein